MNPLSIVCAAATAALLCACDRAEPAPAPSTPPVDVAAVPAPDESTGSTESSESSIVVIPPFDPALPTLELELPPPAEVPAAKPPARAPRPRPPETTATAVEPPSEHLPLDLLLRTPQGARSESSAVDFRAPEEAAAPAAPKPPGTLDRLGQSIRLERRKEAIGVAGPRQGTHYETDAGVRIPVDKGVALEGGVRVDSREEPGAKEPQRSSTPRVGVEVQF